MKGRNAVRHVFLASSIFWFALQPLPTATAAGQACLCSRAAFHPDIKIPRSAISCSGTLAAFSEPGLQIYGFSHGLIHFFLAFSAACYEYGHNSEFTPPASNWSLLTPGGHKSALNKLIFLSFSYIFRKWFS